MAGPAGTDGMSLLEVLVGWTLALTLLIGTLAAVSSLRRSYARTESGLDAAERARMAVEAIARDLRLAGLGVDPDGATGRPDEAVEGAWRGAIAVRGDFDADDPAARDEPERSIAGVFPSVLTGNDEIVAYALRRETASGGLDLSFEADVSSPTVVTSPLGDLVAERDGLVEAVGLARVVAADGGEAGPGCVLYKATVANSAPLWRTGNAILWQPVTDGVSRLDFRYFDDAGEEIAPPGGSESASASRLRIAQVEIRLVAIERRPDPNWSDPSDPDPSTVHYRKAAVSTRVSFRNAGCVARVEGP